MLFNSVRFLIAFGLLLAVVGGMRRAGAGARAENVLLLAASYAFYGAWGVGYLALLLTSTVVDYNVGRRLEVERRPAARRALLGLSVAVNLGILATFKYVDFGVESLAAVLGALGLTPHLPTLGLIVPVGLSFYTFQTLSYTVDVYRGQIAPERDPLAFALFVAFFPQIVAGPIERARDLLPQLRASRQTTRDDVAEGVQWLAVGYTLKVVVADGVAPLVDHTFAAVGGVSGAASLAGLFGFSVQIYGDFAGYSFIALGLARLLGVRLTLNFRAPYLSASPSEFWRRWHVTLMSWFRDYVYIPLGGNRRGLRRQLANVLVVFALSGLWHGAGWAFVTWGVLHGVAVSAGLLWARAGAPRLPRAAAVAGTYLVWVATLLLFRAESMVQAAAIARNVAGGLALAPGDLSAFVVPVVTLHALVFAYQAWRRASDRDAVFLDLPVPARRVAYVGLAVAVAAVGFQPRPYIYFQF